MLVYSFNSQPKAYIHKSKVRLRLIVKRNAKIACVLFERPVQLIRQTKNEKALEIIKKTRAFVSEVDGGRTRNLRIDSPVL
jgi:hypothetical protein